MSLLGWLTSVLVIGTLIVAWLVVKTNRKDRRISQSLHKLLQEAKVLGLPDRDIANAASMLDYNEFGEALEIIVVQLHEYEISISAEYYQQLQDTAKKLKLPEQNYAFAKELIK